ncbi:Tetratricopeptide repeat protein 5 [Blyttiomyces sp. JEL0837]|nr:Tetratricopeptide repeat protein 5 [Blyttiomyces sp. JEL0837]
MQHNNNNTISNKDAKEVTTTTASTNSSLTTSTNSINNDLHAFNPSKYIKIPEHPPTFTTPALDFSSHFADLSEMIESASSFINSYFTLFRLDWDSPVLQKNVIENADSMSVLPAISHQQQQQQDGGGEKGVKDGHGECDTSAVQVLEDVERLRQERVLLVLAAVMKYLNLLTCPPGTIRRRSSGVNGSSTSTTSASDSTAMSVSNSISGGGGLSTSSASKLSTSTTTSTNPSADSTTTTTTLEKNKSLLDSPHKTFDPTLPTNARSKYHLLRGKVYLMAPSWMDSRAEEDLGRCVKLNPECVEGWNCVGEWYWKVGGGEGRKLALSCFENGLLVQRNRDGLLNIAQLTREMAASCTNPTERQEKMEYSVKLCKEALALDIKDGKPWFGLGSTYLNMFFSISFDVKDLMKALAAYNQAQTCPQTSNDPDLYRNRAIIYRYLEYHQQAILDFHKAAELDPVGIGLDARVQIELILRLVYAISKTITRFESADPNLKSTHVPPSQNSRLLHSSFAKLVEVSSIKDLEVASSDVPLDKRQEMHSGKLLRFRVVFFVPSQLPRIFIGLDSKGNYFAVSVFNMAESFIKVDDEVAVASPTVAVSDVAYKDVNVSIRFLRLDRPHLVAVNGLVVRGQNVAFTQVKFENK